MSYPDIQIGIDGYCTLAHVEALNPLRTYGTGTNPTRAQVAIHINDGFNNMNGILDVLGYVTPVSSGAATATRLLRHINALYAAYSVEQSTYSSGNRERSAHGDVLKERYVGEWKKFREGSISLSGASRRSDAFPLANEKHPLYAFRLNAKGTEKEPKFKMDMKF